jgi:hypothetical protein
MATMERMTGRAENHAPLASVVDGRRSNGRFGPGNRCARGNPHAKRVARLRAALFRAADPAEMLIASRKLVEMAKAGDRFAYSEIMDRTIGRPVASDLEERISRLEELAKEERRNNAGAR